VDAGLALLAGAQYGVVERSQLLDLGFAPSAIGRRVAAGRLHLLHRGVYAVGHTALDQRGRWLAAVLAGGDGAVLSHWSAAAQWGIRSNRGGPIHVTSPSKAKSQSPIRRHRAILPADEVTVEDAIPVTTVPRTIFDLAARGVPEHAVESMLRQSEYLRLHDRLSLPDLVARYPRHRGNKAIRAALTRLPERAGHPRSWLEERFLPFIDRRRLPRPQLNAWLRIDGRDIQVDCLWPESMNIVELDGWQGHGTRSAFRDDRARDRRLRVAGYGVTRIAWGSLDAEPEAIAGDLRSLLIQTSVITYSGP
jgi:very-short-patch-repair endonuclease